MTWAAYLIHLNKIGKNCLDIHEAFEITCFSFFFLK